MPGLNPETLKASFLLLSGRVSSETWKENIALDFINNLGPNVVESMQVEVTAEDGTTVSVDASKILAKAIADTLGDHINSAISDLIDSMYTDIAANAVVITTCGSGPGTGTIQ